jgi:hypothetical protein
MAWYHLLTGQTGYPQPEGDFGYFNATYDLDHGCPTCGIGATQKAPFRFRSEPKAKHSQFMGLNWVFDQVFVREQVRNVFEKEGVSGVRFSRPVKHSSGEELTTIYQLHVDTILGEAVEKRDLKVERCEMPTEPGMLRFLTANKSRLVTGPFCGRQKYNYPQGNPLRISAMRLRDQPDFVRTNEWFGSGGAAGRPIIISERVRTLIEVNKWRGAFLQKVECDERIE